MVKANERYWRIRMNYGADSAYEQLSRAAWEQDEVGIWYDGWLAEDFAYAEAKKS